MKPSINAESVRHIARLSRIAVTDDEANTFSRQIEEIRAYFDKLQELDTEGIEPMPHAVELRNVLADDVVRHGLTLEQALANAPQRDEDLFRVPKVLGESQ